MAPKRNRSGSKGTPSLFEMDDVGQQSQAIFVALLPLTNNEDKLTDLMTDAAMVVYTAWTTAIRQVDEGNE